MLSGVTSSRPSQWHWRRPLTTALNEVSGTICTKPHGDRGPPVQRPRTTLYGARRRVWPGIPSSSRCTRKNSGARGLTGFTRSGQQERDQRRTVEQIVDYTLIVPSLDVPVPQMANQLLEVCRQLDTPIPEQVIDVPKISSSRQSRRRRVRFAEQTAEQLVEVPTIVSYSSLHGLVEQNVDIPVPHGRDRVGGGLLGLIPGQSSTALGGARYFPAATAEQIVDTPVPRGGRVLHPASSSSGLPGTANQGVFRTFPRGKKCDVGSALGSELLPESSPSTPAAQLEDFFKDAAGVWMRFPGGWWKLLGSDPEVWRPG